MATYLLKWDPNKWDWRNITELATAVSNGVPVTRPWSCGVARKIAAGDRVFLIRLGREPRGIIASGDVTRGSYEGHNLEPQDTGRGRKGGLFVDVRFDTLVEPTTEAALPRTSLNDGLLSTYFWDIKTSGVQVPDNVAAELERLWFERTHPEEAARRREEEERRAREAAERKTQEAVERKAREEAARKAEADRRAMQKAEAEARAAEQAERKAREEAERKAREEAERKAREEAERKTREAAEAKRQAAEAEAQRKTKEEVERKTREAAARRAQEAEAKRATGPFTIKEALAVVEDYFTMLGAELSGKLYSKADHRNRLVKELGREDEEVEAHYRGISAILSAVGLPFIDAFRPTPMEDTQLDSVVQRFIEENPDIVERLWIADEGARTTVPVELDDAKAFWVSTPSPMPGAGLPRVQWRASVPVEIDFRRRESRNYNLAMAGERFVLAFERARLREAGRKDLIEKIEWTSQNRGIDVGYSIRSFDEQGNDLFVAVKTTNFGPRFPFALSSEEIEFSRSHPDTFSMYRVFHFSRGAKLFMLPGNMEDVCRLEPVTYRAVL